METPVILSAVRTPVGKFQGGLASLSATELGAKAVAEAIRRAELDPKQIDECVMGNVVQAGLGQNPARQAALRGGCESLGSAPHQKQCAPVFIKCDESPREDTSVEALAKLKPAFKKDGTVTAGNAPGTNDGAGALVVTSERNAQRLGKQPIARIVAQAVSGVEPKWVMMAPVDAVEKLLTKTGWDRDKDVDLVELNEAFAVAAIAVTRQLKLNPEKVNVNGGAVALGHPIGASGARILVTLLYELQRRNLKRGVAALCLGGGNAVALAVERY